MRASRALIVMAWAAVTLSAAIGGPAHAQSNPQPNPDGSYTWISDGRTVRPVRLIGPNATISLRPNETLTVISTDGGEAVYPGPFRGTLAEARAREVQSQTPGARVLAFFRQSRNSLRNGGVRSVSDASEVPVAGAPITTLDQIPPIVVLGSPALGPQCVARGLQPRLSMEEPSSRRETIELTVANESHTVVFEPGETLAVWPLARPDNVGGQAATVTPRRPYPPTSFALVNIDPATGDDLLPVLTDAGCLEQAQSVMDYIWKTRTEVLTE